MSTWAKLSWILLFLAALASLYPHTVLAAPAGDDAPPGFKPIASDIGVRLYRKDYPGGTPDYVQVVDLSQGASLRLLSGEVREMRPGKGAYGGNDARILSQSLDQFWRQANQSFERVFCVSNGAFFYMKESPTRLPFPLKIDGQLLSDGYARNEFPGQKLILEIWDGRADIQPLTREALYGSTAAEILGGLSEEANKASKFAVARTFVGVRDDDGDGQYEKLLVFNTQTAKPEDAAEVLRSFSADKVMMLDGGGSTQLLCKEGAFITSQRLIPQAIVTLPGKKPVHPNYLERASIGETGATEAEARFQAEAQTQAQAVALSVEPTPQRRNSQDPGQAATPAENLASDAGLISLTDAVWVPLGFSPMAAILLWVIVRRRQVI